MVLCLGTAFLKMLECMTEVNRLGDATFPGDFYSAFRHPMSRLRVLDIHLMDSNGLMDEKSAQSVSTLFLSLMLHARSLVEFSHGQSCACWIGLLKATKVVTATMGSEEDKDP